MRLCHSAGHLLRLLLSFFTQASTHRELQQLYMYIITGSERRQTLIAAEINCPSGALFLCSCRPADVFASAVITFSGAPKVAPEIHFKSHIQSASYCLI